MDAGLSLRVVVFESANPGFYLAHYDLTGKTGTEEPAAKIRNMLGTRPTEPTSPLAESLQQAKNCGLKRDRYGTQ